MQFENDVVLIPRETSWFGYYPDGAFDPVLPPQKVEFLSCTSLIQGCDLAMQTDWQHSGSADKAV
jgi:hypothetical protein